VVLFLPLKNYNMRFVFENLIIKMLCGVTLMNNEHLSDDDNEVNVRDADVPQLQDLENSIIAAGLCSISLFYLYTPNVQRDIVPTLIFSASALVFTTAMGAQRTGCISSETASKIQKASLAAAVVSATVLTLKNN